MSHPLKNIVEAQKKGIPIGIYSACTANELAIEAVMERAEKSEQYVLVESTANQVDQYGGYTGMKPEDFAEFVSSIARKVGFPEDKIILGGDHLGPLSWKDNPADKAMEEAKELVKQYVMAGFTKIHIDTSMHLGDDDTNIKLDTEVIAERGAILADVAERAYAQLKENYPDAVSPVYVIGSEVPIPGGSQEEEEGIQVTRVADLQETIYLFSKAFQEYNLKNAWEKVIAVVVQPGVEFGDDSVHEYKRSAAQELVSAIKNYPNLVFEGHSTDYQTPQALKEMVEDGIAILKVGPALTFALREALFALNHIENELFKGNDQVKTSNFIEVLEEEMLKAPENWNKHYHGDENRLRLSRKYSFSDRSRYYLPIKEVDDAINKMFINLKSEEIPLVLISQYMPVQYTKIRKGILGNDPESLVKDRIINCIDEYLYATSSL